MHVYLLLIIKNRLSLLNSIVGAIGDIVGMNRKGENDATIFSLKFRK